MVEGWALALILAAILLFMLEMFIPSGGMLGFLSVICLVAGIVCLFWVDTTLGMIGLIATLVLIPVAMSLGLRVFPHTPTGRRLILSEKQDSARDLSYEPARDENPAALVGVTGEALTDLRPVGICQIDGNRLECLSESGMLASGTPIKVTAVNGIEIKVRAVS